MVTDGEFRRSTYTSNFTTEGLTGVTAEHKASDVWSYTNAKGHKEPARTPAVHARIRWNNSRNADDFAALARMTRVHPKVTLPGPCYIHFRAGRAGISRAAYPDLADFWSDIVTAYGIELEKLAEAGCRYVQLDETSIAKLGDEKIRNALAARGDHWEELLEHARSPQLRLRSEPLASRTRRSRRIGLRARSGSSRPQRRAAQRTRLPACSPINSGHGLARPSLSTIGPAVAASSEWPQRHMQSPTAIPW
jgi:hypothetical protein